jgi:hypothetical protein
VYTQLAGAHHALIRVGRGAVFRRPPSIRSDSMAMIQPLRGDMLGGDPAANDTDPAGAALRPWLAGRPSEERLVDLLAFGLATERGLLASPDVIHAQREQAYAALATYSIRNLHNRVAEIRQEAVLDHMGRFARPMGFIKIVMANLLALILAGAAAGALYLHPETLAALAGLLPG